MQKQALKIVRRRDKSFIGCLKYIPAVDLVWQKTTKIYGGRKIMVLEIVILEMFVLKVHISRLGFPRWKMAKRFSSERTCRKSTTTRHGN